MGLHPSGSEGAGSNWEIVCVSSTEDVSHDFTGSRRGIIGCVS